mgnify:FL=1
MNKEEKDVNVHEVLAGALSATAEFMKNFEKEVCSENGDVPKEKFEKWAKSNPFKRLYEDHKAKNKLNKV